MRIQQSINQALGISALLASQSPMAAAHKEKVLNQQTTSSFLPQPWPWQDAHRR